MTDPGAFGPGIVFNPAVFEPAVVMRQKVFRTGKQTLWRKGGTFYMTIRNRSYRSTQQVPLDRVPAWMDYFDR